MAASSYSVKAVLSAVDQNFTSTFKKAEKTVTGIDRAIGGMAFGAMAGIGMAAFNTVASAAKGFVGDIYNVGSGFETATSQIAATMQVPTPFRALSTKPGSSVHRQSTRRPKRLRASISLRSLVLRQMIR